MWLLLAFLSATLLGFYDSFKKKSLLSNAVIPVLFLNTVFSSLIFLPFIIFSATAPFPKPPSSTWAAADGKSISTSF